MKSARLKAHLICILSLSAGLVSCNNVGVVPNTGFTSTPRSVEPSDGFPTQEPLRDAPGLTSRECSGDTALPTLATGWTLLWQQVFTHPIARPPEIADAQLILLERADPFAGEYQDKIWVMSPQTGAVHWQFEGFPDATLPVRWIRELDWSQKYLALFVQYQAREGFCIPEQYLVVLERSTGHIMHTGRISALEMTVSDDAVYYRDEFRGLARIDLPGGERRWRTPEIGGFWSGIFVSGPLLYSFQLDRIVYLYNSMDGTLVTTGTLGVPPLLGDVLTQSHLAVARSGREGVVLFDLQTLEPRWKAEVDYLSGSGTNAFEGNIPSMTATSDAVYLFDARDNLLRINLSSGQITWRAPSPGVQAMSRPVVAHGFVYSLFADGTLRAFATEDGSPVGVVMTVPLWYWVNTDTWVWRDLVGGLGVADDILIVTTGCRSVYAIQREN